MTNERKTNEKTIEFIELFQRLSAQEKEDFIEEMKPTSVYPLAVG
jgi:hypothetical protein